MSRPLPPSMASLLLLVAIPVGLFAPIVGPLSPVWRLTGLVPAIVGLRLAHSAHTLFEKLGTEIGTFEDPGVLVATGPFAYTRNPMYLGIGLVLAGVSLIVGSLTVWLAPIGFAVIAHRWYIPFEERKMEAKFGEQYDDYRTNVPRWLGPVGRTRQLTA